MTNQTHTDAIAEFRRLSPRDQAAVAKHLSLAERERLGLIEAPRGSTTVAPKRDSEPDWTAHSPWLAKHLTRAMAKAEAGTSTLTPAAQRALFDCLSRSAPGADG